jgi:TM2 domain-containing membrane protein YozV
MLLFFGLKWSLILLGLLVVALVQWTRATTVTVGAVAPQTDFQAHGMTEHTGDSAAGGGPPLTDQKYCSGCGILIHKTAMQCPRCGAPQMATPHPLAPLGEKSRVAAIIFALLLGGIGVHKFYLGRIGQGVLYVLFCWTCVPTIVGLVEGIVYLTMTDAAFAAKYG